MPIFKHTTKQYHPIKDCAELAMTLNSLVIKSSDTLNLTMVCPVSAAQAALRASKSNLRLRERLIQDIKAELHATNTEFKQLSTQPSVIIGLVMAAVMARYAQHFATKTEASE